MILSVVYFRENIIDQLLDWPDTQQLDSAPIWKLIRQHFEQNRMKMWNVGHTARTSSMSGPDITMRVSFRPSKCTALVM